MERADMEFFESLFRSLEGEMRQRFSELESEMREGFASVNARLNQTNDRLDRIGGLVNGGARAIARLAEWSERTDVTTAQLLHRVAEIEERLRKLEGKKD